LNINSAFDGGNISVQSIHGDLANLEIAPDQQCSQYQWFYFCVDSVLGRAITLNINNAGTSSFPKGWSGYQARYSIDGIDWKQEVNTRYLDGVLSIKHYCNADRVWFAYFAPYTSERHQQLLCKLVQQPGVMHQSLGCSIEGRSIDYFQLGSQLPNAKQIWLFALQHPGETMAQWWTEGALEMLIAPDDHYNTTIVEQLLAQCRFHVVPNMNPDGSARGHLRTNALGIDLNRQWQTPSLDKSPEVFYVWQQMLKTGVDFAMDIHGDETIPANFIAGFKGIPNLSAEKWELFVQFRTLLTAQHHDFQDQLGYGDAAPGQANLTIATNAIAHHFNCVALTLEMPFKDHDSNPVPMYGWNPQRCKGLARACLITLLGLIKRL
jgi:murein tripeptide amidase MpaA